jgi:hypothetical protein
VDRLLPLISPLFRKAGDMTHHALRHERRARWVAIAWNTTPSPERARFTPVAPMVVRSFDMGHGVAAHDRQLANESPVLAALFTASDGPGDWLAAGLALQRLLRFGTPMKALPAAPRRPPSDVLAAASKRRAVTAWRARLPVQPGGLCDRRACIHGNAA